MLKKLLSGLLFLLMIGSGALADNTDTWFTPVNDTGDGTAIIDADDFTAMHLHMTGDWNPRLSTGVRSTAETAALGTSVYRWGSLAVKNVSATGTLEVTGQITGSDIQLTGAATIAGVTRVGTNAAFADFPAAQMIVSRANTTFTSPYLYGLVSEAKSNSTSGVGVLGVALTNSTYLAQGVYGKATRGSTDNVEARGVVGESSYAHSVGKNIGVYAAGSGGTGAAADYSFYGASGILYNAGSVTIEGQVSITGASRARAGRTGSVQSINSQETTVVVFNTENYDNLGEYDNSTGIFTAIASGYYAVASVIELAGATTDQGVYIIGIYVNSASYKQVSSRSSGTAGFSMAISDVVYIPAGQTLKIGVWLNEANTLNYDAAGCRTNLSIHRIS
ncbi:MAG: hypothetical protein WC529_08840 [Candidatus Margulisiibacteriota bacterium]